MKPDHLIRKSSDSTETGINSAVRENGIYIHRDGSAEPVFIHDSGFLRLHQVLQLIPVSKSSWWASVASGRFPKAHKIGANTTCWKVSEIRQLLATLTKKEA